MLFKYYFFKEGTRNYEVTDLLSYFHANPYIDVIKGESDDIVARYYNPTFDFSANFVIASKSNIRGIQRLNPAYIDVNLHVEFPLLTPNYNVNLIITICEDLCRMFNFYVYNEVFQDVSPFRRSLLLKAFEITKQAYKKTYPEEVSGFYRLETNELNQVYDYLSQINILNDLLKNDDILVPTISFYAVEGKRRVYTSIEISREEAFVFPSFVDMVHINDVNDDVFIAKEEFISSTKKYFHSIESNISGLFFTSSKDKKKISKILSKTKFSPLILELKPVDFKKVLDL